MTRQLLPARRSSQTFKFEHVNPSGHVFDYTATVGYYDDGRPGEVFLSSSKLSTDQDISASEAAILLSFALQHGASFAAIRTAMIRGEDGKPHGVIGTLCDLLA